MCTHPPKTNPSQIFLSPTELFFISRSVFASHGEYVSHGVFLFFLTEPTEPKVFEPKANQRSRPKGSKKLTEFYASRVFSPTDDTDLKDFTIRMFISLTEPTDNTEIIFLFSFLDSLFRLREKSLYGSHGFLCFAFYLSQSYFFISRSVFFIFSRNARITRNFIYRDAINA